ncbi:MAG: hypothetical protein ACRDS9_17930 [Pseudonocardiaceae bacterium]
MNDPWADALAAAPKITAHQVSRIVELIADYTTAEATDLIATLASRRAPSLCCGGFVDGIGTHTRTCPTQGGRLD